MSADTTYDSLIDSASNSVYLGESSGVTGYVFELFQADISLTEDPSFALATFGGGATFDKVDAVATYDVASTVFNSLFYITVDSSDIDDTAVNDVRFSIDDSFTNPFTGGIAFSDATVQSGNTNVRYADQVLKKDVVRHIAKEVTGGYGVADIFSNETALLDDVVSRDADIHTQLSSVIEEIRGADGVTVDGIADIDNLDKKRFYQIAHTLFGIIVNDPSGRQSTLYEDLSNASYNVDGNGLPSESVTIPLKFKAGDAIALHISYDPSSSPVAGDGMGSNTISNRSYKILLRLTEG